MRIAKWTSTFTIIVAGAIGILQGGVAHGVDNAETFGTCDTDLGIDADTGIHYLGCCSEGAHGVGGSSNFSCECDAGRTPNSDGITCSVDTGNGGPGTPPPIFPGGGGGGVDDGSGGSQTEECICDAEKAGTVKPKGECTKDPKCHVKQTCFNCNKDRNNDRSALVTKRNNCETNYRRISEDKCRQNRWRAGDPRPSLGSSMGRWLTPVGAPLRPYDCHMEGDDEGPPEPGHHRVRHTVCVRNTDFDACEQTWMDTYPGHSTVTDGGFWGSEIKSVGVDGVFNVSFGGTTTTINVGTKEGYSDMCEAGQSNAEKALIDKFDKCADQAKKDEGPQCRAW
jgi:hypothetical protein